MKNRTKTWDIKNIALKCLLSTQDHLHFYFLSIHFLYLYFYISIRAHIFISSPYFISYFIAFPLWSSKFLRKSLVAVTGFTLTDKNCKLLYLWLWTSSIQADEGRRTDDDEVPSCEWATSHRCGWARVAVTTLLWGRRPQTSRPRRLRVHRGDAWTERRRPWGGKRRKNLNWKSDSVFNLVYI